MISFERNPLHGFTRLGPHVPLIRKRVPPIYDEDTAPLMRGCWPPRFVFTASLNGSLSLNYVSTSASGRTRDAENEWRERETPLLKVERDQAARQCTVPRDERA